MTGAGGDLVWSELEGASGTAWVRVRVDDDVVPGEILLVDAVLSDSVSTTLERTQPIPVE